MRERSEPYSRGQRRGQPAGGPKRERIANASAAASGLTFPETAPRSPVYNAAMPTPHKPKKRPAQSRPHRQPPQQPHPPSPQRGRPARSTQELATRVFHQLLDEKATPETVVEGLRKAGLDAETLGELLRAVRGCIEFAEDLPADVEDFDADELADYLCEDLEIEPDLALDVVDAFYSLGEEA